jgi:hypothetical protein
MEIKSWILNTLIGDHASNVMLFFSRKPEVAQVSFAVANVERFIRDENHQKNVLCVLQYSNLAIKDRKHALTSVLAFYFVAKKEKLIALNVVNH